MGKGCRKFLKHSRKMALRSISPKPVNISATDEAERSAFSIYQSKMSEVGSKTKRRRGRPKKKPIVPSKAKFPKGTANSTKRICHWVDKSIAEVENCAGMETCSASKKVTFEDMLPDEIKSLSRKSNSPIVGILKKNKPNSFPDVTNSFPNSFEKFDCLDNADELDDASVLFTACVDSKKEGKEVFEWLIAPHSLEGFLSEYWEKKPLHISRQHEGYYKFMLNLPGIDRVLRQEVLKFSENIDITSYEDGERQTHNPVGRALPHVVWDFYTNNCSVRILNPQSYFPKIHTLNATLQEFFNCFVGANIYLTPPDSQGFAPHYDDIEAFILQIEGKKLWKIYSPLTSSDILPRVSSRNFKPSDLKMPPLMEVVLEAGDMLYFPRGFIHQASTIQGEHSLHITISTYQKHSWADYFETMMPVALDAAIQNEPELRKGVPFDMYENLGLIHTDSNKIRRVEIIKHISTLFHKIYKHLPYDDAADQCFKGYIHDALPPIIPEKERHLTVFGDTDQIDIDGSLKNRVEIQLETEIKLLRANILRMVAEDDAIRLYHYIENAKEYRENEIQFLEIDDILAPAVEKLIVTYPNFIAVKKLEAGTNETKLRLISDLWERGLIKCKYPLDIIE